MLTFLIQGMISESGETGLSYNGNNYNVYTSTTSSLGLDIGDIGFSDRGPSYVFSYARDGNNFNAQNTQVRIGHSTNYGGTVNITEYRNNLTASIAGFFTGSAGNTNQQAGAVPFVLFNDKAGVRNSTSPAFVIEQTFPATGSSPNPTFRIDHNGNISKVGYIVFSGNVSGSGTNSSYFGDEYNAHGGDVNSGFTLLSLGGKPSIFASGASLEIGNAVNTTQTGIHLVGEVTASGNISASSQIVGNSFKVQQAAAGPTDTSLIISGSTFDGDHRDAQIIYPNHGLHFNSNNSDNHVLALAGNNVGIRKQPDDGNALQISGSISMVIQL